MQPPPCKKEKPKECIIVNLLEIIGRKNLFSSLPRDAWLLTKKILTPSYQRYLRKN